MWYAPATCRYAETYGWMPQRVGEATSTWQSDGGSDPDAATQKAKDAATVAVQKWNAAFKHAMTYHVDYLPALKANKAAQAAEAAWRDAALKALNAIYGNYADVGSVPAKSLTQPYNDQIATANQQIDFLESARVTLVTDMAGHVQLGGSASSPGGLEAAAAAHDAGAAKPVGTPKAPVSPEDADDPTKPPPASEDGMGGALEWGQIAGWAAVVAVGGWIFWRVVSGRGLA